MQSTRAIQLWDTQQKKNDHPTSKQLMVDRVFYFFSYLGVVEISDLT